MFNVEKTKDEIVNWIRNYFEENGKGCNAIVGISGGKDSSIVASLCVEALGKERVIGVLMPQGEQHDIGYSQDLIKHLGIKSLTVNIKPCVSSIFKALRKGNEIKINKQAKINTPARIRMTMLYAVSASLNGRVANTSNLSEDFVGYSTKYGDSAGDFSPLSQLTATEVKQIGKALKLPAKFIDKIPEDGLSGKTDEANLGFSYDVLDKYIREGVCQDKKIKRKIDKLHNANLHKSALIPSYDMR